MDELSSAFDQNGATALAVRPLVDGAALLVGTTAPFLWLDSNAAIFAAGWWVATWAVIRCDLVLFIIPDTASAAILLLGLAHAAGLGEAVAPSERGMMIVQAAASGFAGFALFFIVAAAYRRFHGRDGLGFGDVKLAGACAVWLEPRDAVLALEIATLSALAVVLLRGRAGRDVAVPFGAFLAAAAWLAFVLGPAWHGIVDG